MSLLEQEEILVKNLNEIHSIEKEIKQALAKVRGGTKYIAVEARPDEILLKS